MSRLGLDSTTHTYVVILQEKGGARLLPIWIGQPEAESIVMQMNNAKRERPFTHDLCKSLILGLGGTLRRVQITKVQQRTYFAELHLAGPHGAVQIDARPSDSIAIALRLHAPIFVQESLLGTMEVDDDETPGSYATPPATPPSATPNEELNAEQLKAYLENLRPEDFGRFNL
ncbi:bifunctional nuclease family protein [Roseisolibacter sp. H3M3-2]|uniref:bifunctional nuclease family protein n=1 Tax=Roseisolibacter sp. H3M3-2 TaxID=3031323 RepID=UPI0023DCDB17|nr:bifunctional nuclease family protein [Roseisolibacter sp. H3M3-2]